MAAQYDHHDHEGILFHRAIRCPVCGEKALSFRVIHVVYLRSVETEFYHRTSSCTGSIAPSLPAVMDLLRLVAEGGATSLERGEGGVENMECSKIGCCGFDDKVGGSNRLPPSHFPGERLPLLIIPPKR